MYKYSRMKLTLLLVAGAVLCSSFLRADSIYSNYTTLGGAGSSLSVNEAVALPFITLAANQGFAFALSDIEFVAYANDPSANPVTIGLYAASEGFPLFPGVPMEFFTPDIRVFNSAIAPDPLTNPDPSSSPSDYLITVTSTLHPILVPGEEYWIVLSDPQTFEISWLTNGNTATNPASYTTLDGWVSLGVSYSQGDAQVNGDLVPVAPEPGTFLAFGSGLAAVIMLTRRRVRQ